MGAEVTVFLVEDRQLQGVDHAAHGVDDATRQKPSEGLARKGRDDLSKGEHADPAHGNVDQGRKPLGQVIHSALMRMPTAAMPHTSARRSQPVRSPRTSMQTGV